MKKAVCIATIILTFLSTTSAFAHTDTRIMRAFCDEQDALLFVLNAGESNRLHYQIGNVICEQIEQKSIVESGYGFRTIILVDNSLSISQENRVKENELIHSIVERHVDNEEIRIATFSEDIEYLSDYSTDYKALGSVVDSIDYKNQDTYLTDVLYNLIDELSRENYVGYIRLIVISDGVDNKPIGITKDELYAKIKKYSCPIYSIGTRGKNNDSELENMFAISRVTNADYFILDDTEDIEEITDDLIAESNICVFRAVLPNEVKNGEYQNSKLILDDENELVVEIQTPFGSISENEEQYASSYEEKEPVADDNDNDLDTSTDESIEISNGLNNRSINIEYFFQDYLRVIICIISILFLLTIVLIAHKVSKKKEKKDRGKDLFEKTENEEAFENAMTELISSKSEDGGTEMIFGGLQDAKHIYNIVLTDKNNPSKAFEHELRDVAIVGRSSEMADIAITYDKSVGRKHCAISQSNGRFYIKDLGSINRTKLNGTAIYNEEEIKNGDILTLGRVELYISII